MLINSNTPYAISPNILSMAQIVNKSTTILLHIPLKSCVQIFYNVIINMKKTLASHWLVNIFKNDMLTCGMRYWQNDCDNFIVILLNNDKYKTIWLSASIIIEDDTSRSQSNLLIATTYEVVRLLSQYKNGGVYGQFLFISFHISQRWIFQNWNQRGN